VLGNDRLHLSGEPGTPSPLHGRTGYFRPQTTTLANPQVHTELVSVAALTVDTAYDMTLTVSTDAGSPSGVKAITIIEVPLASTSPTQDPTNEIGCAALWASSGNSIDSDTFTIASGLARLNAEYERALFKNRRQFQYVWPENTTGALHTTSATFVALRTAAVHPANYKARVRRYYETTVPMRHQGAWRSWCVGGGTAELRLKIDGTVVQTWSGLVGAVAESPFKDFDVPTNTTNQYVHLSLEGKVSAGDLYVSRFAWEEKF
jgi:hypothetical protein